MKYNKIKKKSKELNVNFEYVNLNLNLIKDVGIECAFILSIINLLDKNPSWNGYTPVVYFQKLLDTKSNKLVLNCLEKLKNAKLITIKKSKNGVARYWNKISLTEHAKKTYNFEFKPKIFIINNGGSKNIAVKPSWYEDYKAGYDIKTIDIDKNIEENDLKDLVDHLFD